MTNAILDRIDGKDPIVSRSLYSIQDHLGKVYVRSSDFWGSDLDLTGVSPWNSSGGVTKAGVLITPRHFMVSAHFGDFGIGATIRFIGWDGEVFDRTVVKGKWHPNYNASIRWPDIQIYVLDSDLPANIKHYKILPGNLSDYVSNDALIHGKPLLFGTEQHELATIGKTNYSDWKYLGFERPTPLPNGFFIDPHPGDSSSAYFYVINDEPILAFVLTGIGGTAIHLLISDINQLIADVDALAGFSTGYRVETVDLSGFSIYD